MFYLISWFYHRQKNEIGLGGGDVKYLTAIGAFLGIWGVFFVMFLSSGMALIVFIVRELISRKKHKIIPYGPFLAVSAFFYILFEGLLKALFEFIH